MSANFRQRNLKIWGLLAITIIIVWGIVVWQLYEGRATTKEMLLDLELSRFEEKIESTLLTYESFSNYIFDQIEQEEEILSLIHQANSETDEGKAILREQLYNRLYPRYATMEKYKFRQLHFHLPSTESFLRIHKPELFGDLLADDRESVRLANEEQRKVTGFEEGKIYNGFRYVYPLNYNDEHIGSVEVSLSSASIMEVLKKLYVTEDFHFIIQKSVVVDTVFAEELVNYRPSANFTGYFIDREVEKNLSVYNTIVPGDQDLFFKELNVEYGDKIKEKKSFAAFYNFKDQNYIVKFSAIENIKEVPVAYLISITESVRYQRIVNDMRAQVSLVTILAGIIIIFSLVLFIFQHKLKDTLELDYLTRIYNRKTFYEIVDSELNKSRKCKYLAAVLMFDIDHFKKINDTYGHAWGDQVIQELVSLIAENLRSTDVFVRWGGEEFVILLPQVKKDEALQVAEKIRALVDDATSKRLKDVTVSIGVSRFTCDDPNIDNAINRADEAMYCAKNQGRNQVCYQ